MDLQQDVEQKIERGVGKILSYTLQTSKLTEAAFKTLLNKAKTGIAREDRGKDKYSTTTIGQMTKNGNQITVIDEGMLPDMAKRFYKYAGRQKIPFTMLTDNSKNPPMYHLCIYKSQEGVFKNIVKNFMDSEKQMKPSLRKKLQVKNKEARDMNISRQAERGNHERSR